MHSRLRKDQKPPEAGRRVRPRQPLLPPRGLQASARSEGCGPGGQGAGAVGAPGALDQAHAPGAVGTAPTTTQGGCNPGILLTVDFHSWEPRDSSPRCPQTRVSRPRAATSKLPGTGSEESGAARN